MLKKYWLILHCKLLYKMGQDFLDRENIRITSCVRVERAKIGLFVFAYCMLGYLVSFCSPFRQHRFGGDTALTLIASAGGGGKVSHATQNLVKSFRVSTIIILL